MISLSVRLSRALVASSQRSNGDDFKNARARATLCFSPPLSFKPRSPTRVSYPSASPRIASCMDALFAASSIALSSLPSFPYSILYRTLSLKSGTS
mmetsp:Transcript_2774/g.3143  ORF Transcript_2774/g.3143 Transcript_2774/m.3143 type:complete len:96 (-) Transcript_2774:9-296(-)